MKPAPNQTFGEYGDRIVGRLKSCFHQYERIDLVFDRYDGNSSIKNIERLNRGATSGGDIIIHSPKMPIPNWDRFKSCEANKVRLCNFLVEYLISKSEDFTKPLVIGGGSIDPTKALVISPGQVKPSPKLQSDHEEADTTMLLHAKHAFEEGYNVVTINAPDTDVFVIAAHHLQKLNDSLRSNLRLWFHTGSGIHERILPIHK
jgi:hypothetical protein